MFLFERKITMQKNMKKRIPIDELTPEERFERRLREYHIHTDDIDDKKTEEDSLCEQNIRHTNNEQG